LTRAFVAVRPPAAVLEAIGATVARLEATIPDVRWAAPEQWHVTLQFLGNRADVDAVASALTGVDVRGGEAQLGGGGAFSSPRRASVAWLGVNEGTELLTTLADAVSTRLTPLGHEREARPFHPHITVARARGRSTFDARAFVAAVPPVIGPAWTVAEVIVYESVLRRAGAQYVERATIALR
jgi:2'-5' RNA ligase